MGRKVSQKTATVYYRIRMLSGGYLHRRSDWGSTWDPSECWSDSSLSEARSMAQKKHGKVIKVTITRKDTGLPIRVGDVWRSDFFGEFTVMQISSYGWLMGRYRHSGDTHMKDDSRKRGEWTFVRRGA